MKYLIQIFISESNIGKWENTNFGGNDLAQVIKTADKIANENRQGIVKVRILEVLQEFEAPPKDWRELQWVPD